MTAKTKSAPPAVTAAPEFAIGGSLPAAVVGEPYRHGFEHAHGAHPVTFSLHEGSLPPGLRLMAGGGVRGHATEPADCEFTVRAHDANGDVAEYRHKLSSHPAPAKEPAGAPHEAEEA